MSGEGRRVLHLLDGLEVGGKQRAALRLARRGLAEGERHGLLLFDAPFRDAERDFDPGEVPTRFLPRGPGLDLAFARRLARLVRAERVSAVHAHNDSALVYAALAALLAGRTRVVGTFHTWPSRETPRAQRLTRLAGRLSRPVAVSDELAARLVSEGWLRDCGVVRNGVELDRFVPGPDTGGWRRRLGVAAGAVLVGHLARLDPIKRHEDLLAAAAILRERAPGVVILLVGRGRLEEEVAARAAGLPNLRRLTRAEDVAGLMRALDLLVLCSSEEAAPLVLLEALACGVPAVVTAVGGMPRMLGEGTQRAGLVVPPFDPPALAAAIASLAGSAGERARLAPLARARAERFPFEAEWRAYRALYGGAASPDSAP